MSTPTMKLTVLRPYYVSSLDGARGHVVHEPLREEQVQDEHGQGGDHESRREHADVLVLIGHEELDGEGQGADLLLGDEDDRVEELVPEVDEVEDHGGGHGGEGH